MSDEGKRVFLIQSSGKRPAKHLTVTFEDRTNADEVVKFNYYRHEVWERKKDRDFGEVRVGDYVLHYCTGDVDPDYGPSQIKRIYEVIKLEPIPGEDIESALASGRITPEKAEELRTNPHILRLRLLHELKKGLELSLIREWVRRGKLSPEMDNCGKLGFNICKVSYKDYEAIMEWDREAPPSPLPTPREREFTLREEELRNYIASRPLKEVLGDEYSNYELYEDEEGRIGELYRTPVGEIDLLYRNKDTGDFLVIELKITSDTPDPVVGQIARYIGYVKENLAKGGRVSSAIIVRTPNEKLKYAVRSLENCILVTFEPRFIFSRVV